MICCAIFSKKTLQIGRCKFNRRLVKWPVFWQTVWYQSTKSVGQNSENCRYTTFFADHVCDLWVMFEVAWSFTFKRRTFYWTKFPCFHVTNSYDPFKLFPLMLNNCLWKCSRILKNNQKYSSLCHATVCHGPCLGKTLNTSLFSPGFELVRTSLK